MVNADWLHLHRSFANIDWCSRLNLLGNVCAFHKGDIWICVAALLYPQTTKILTPNYTQKRNNEGQSYLRTFKVIPIFGMSFNQSIFVLIGL